MSNGAEPSRISIVEIRIEEISKAQSLMHNDLKQSLEKFVLVMKVLSFALVIELLIQAALMSILILKDSNKELKVNKDGFNFSIPHPLPLPQNHSL